MLLLKIRTRKVDGQNLDPVIVLYLDIPYWDRTSCYGEKIPSKTVTLQYLKERVIKNYE